QPLFIDDVEPRQAVLRAIIELDIENKRLKQVVFEQRRNECRSLFETLMDREQYGIHPFQEFAATAVFTEQGLARRAADAGAVEVDVNHHFLVGNSDQERLPFHHQGQIRGIPGAGLEEQVLPLHEAKQGDRLKLALSGLAKHDGLVRLDAAKLRREGGANITLSP